MILEARVYEDQAFILTRDGNLWRFYIGGDGYPLIECSAQGIKLDQFYIEVGRAKQRII